MTDGTPGRTPRGVRPGRRPGPSRSLTTRAVAEAALAEGLATFSMPSVAARLGVSHSTLYRYVQDRDDLLRTAIGVAVDRVEWPSEELPWRELLGRLADRLWELCDTHPGIAQAVLTTPGTPPAIIDRLVRYGRSLVAAGLSDRDAVVSVDFVAELTLTSWIAMRHLDGETAAGGGRTVREEYRSSWSVDTPFLEVFTAEDTWHGRGWFTDKLGIYLDGLAHRIDSRTGTGGPHD
ncbi:TetR/AcrR family transcriptional regulator [Streptomyces uncialis]|uniref:TetR/AcrR family transcriptional regulator n=1 Tax=Streptomyces uncialis TaxID=1048205 RepID=UPI0037B77B2E